MPKISQFLQFGWCLPVYWCGLSATAIAAIPPPVVRAPANVPQLPLCYIEMPNQQRLSLNDACFMGKQMARSRLFDLVTDLDKDGVPDELAGFFERMDRAMNMSLNATPEARLAQAAQQREIFKEFARRAPVAADIKAALNQMAEMMYQSAKLTREPSAAQRQEFAQMDQVMKKVQNDPFMKTVDAYSDKYRTNRLKLNNPSITLP
ncbi:hypothetical protein IQ266_09210 [filamentous cyanobacterium LEGE 11480]|uniref:Uncharacterized protein n=1 Tax=Romeriopsis navalis LEGE 11480 TaxID=2777977 RepID=A0A928VPV9_9CYAN|nr:hypothetical protein [Romeriopsis navalis]MBE9029904.1 hypothetical protein [Romeriopsis navalis LEGE 11480]